MQRIDKSPEPKAYFSIETAASPARGLPTLYVLGKRREQDIITWIDRCPQGPKHVRFGCNGTFDGRRLDLWVELIAYFLREGYWVSLEMLPYQSHAVIATGLCRHSRFIPIVTFHLPQISKLGRNAAIVMDDKPQWSLSTRPWSMSVNQFVYLAEKLGGISDGIYSSPTQKG